MDVQKLLGQFLGSQGGSLGQLGNLARGGARPGQAGAPGGSIVDQLGGLMRGPAGGAIGGVLTSGLASQLFRSKGIGKMGGSALKLGGAAIVAGLAYKAYQAYQANNAAAPALPGAAPVPALGAAPRDTLPAAAGTAFLPQGEEDSRARLMLSAMIAAAKADGYIDAREEEAIFGRIEELGLDAEEKGFLMDEMRRPMSVDQLAAKARSPEIAMEIYTASVLAVDIDHPAERAYLDLLGARLNLPAELTAEIRRTADEAQA
ncbi:tellurite resistance TerB family protein [Aurantimonas sp. Leaf443]|uniref:tellurite resistance TerB family protein n=1 Tax=Aurantimonas sp. Leaf443 TaxID=1736378 RepID=UPI000701FC27|nr:tellurite resistance TerB family protein [Aurantimonas sp. Leaf443]KQT82231.1 hypothetical protein ASG48_16500 [Aurantimonas sp. Leaf443]